MCWGILFVEFQLVFSGHHLYCLHCPFIIFTSDIPMISPMFFLVETNICLKATRHIYIYIYTYIYTYIHTYIYIHILYILYIVNVYTYVNLDPQSAHKNRHQVAQFLGNGPIPMFNGKVYGYLMHLWCSGDPIISHPVLLSRTGPPGFIVVSPIVRLRCNIPIIITSPIQWLVNPHVTHVNPFNFHGVLKSNLSCSHVAAQLTPASPSKSRAMKSSCAISWRERIRCSLPAPKFQTPSETVFGVGLRDPNTFWRTFEALRILHHFLFESRMGKTKLPLWEFAVAMIQIRL